MKPLRDGWTLQPRDGSWIGPGGASVRPVAVRTASGVATMWQPERNWVRLALCRTLAEAQRVAEGGR